MQGFCVNKEETDETPSFAIQGNIAKTNANEKPVYQTIKTGLEPIYKKLKTFLKQLIHKTELDRRAIEGKSTIQMNTAEITEASEVLKDKTPTVQTLEESKTGHKNAKAVKQPSLSAFSTETGKVKQNLMDKKWRR